MHRTHQSLHSASKDCKNVLLGTGREPCLQVVPRACRARQALVYCSVQSAIHRCAQRGCRPVAPPPFPTRLCRHPCLQVAGSLHGTAAAMTKRILCLFDVDGTLTEPRKAGRGLGSGRREVPQQTAAALAEPSQPPAPSWLHACHCLLMLAACRKWSRRWWKRCSGCGRCATRRPTGPGLVDSLAADQPGSFLLLIFVTLR